MKWLLAAGAGVLVIVLASVLLGGRDEKKVLRDGPIIAFGDSLVYGTGSSGGGFVPLLQARLGREVVSRGVPGDTTADGLERLETVIAEHPSVVILLLGGNDYLRRMSADDTKQNLAAIIERLQADGAAVLLLGVRGGVLRDNFAGMYDDLANEYDVAFVPDVLDGLLGDDAAMADEIHPSDAGYRAIAERVYPVLARMLE